MALGQHKNARGAENTNDPSGKGCKNLPVFGTLYNKIHALGRDIAFNINPCSTVNMPTKSISAFVYNNVNITPISCDVLYVYNHWMCFKCISRANLLEM